MYAGSGQLLLNMQLEIAYRDRSCISRWKFTCGVNLFIKDVFYILLYFLTTNQSSLNLLHLSVNIQPVNIYLLTLIY